MVLRCVICNINPNPYQNKDIVVGPDSQLWAIAIGDGGLSLFV